MTSFPIDILHNSFKSDLYKIPLSCLWTWGEMHTFYCIPLKKKAFILTQGKINSQYSTMHYCGLDASPSSWSSPLHFQHCPCKIRIKFVRCYKSTEFIGIIKNKPECKSTACTRAQIYFSINTAWAFCDLITVKSCSMGCWWFTVLFLWKLMYKSHNETLYVFDKACLEACTPDLFKNVETLALKISLVLSFFFLIKMQWVIKNLLQGSTQVNRAIHAIYFTNFQINQSHTHFSNCRPIRLFVAFLYLYNCVNGMKLGLEIHRGRKIQNHLAQFTQWSDFPELPTILRSYLQVYTLCTLSSYI